MLTVTALLLLLSLGSAHTANGQARREQAKTFEDALKEFSSATADSCEGDRDLSRLEADLFGLADHAVLNALDSTGGLIKATTVLRDLEKLSAEVNATWPEENRFHFTALDLSPAFAVRMSYRNRATFSFFAINEGKWLRAGSLDDGRYDHSRGYEYFELFPLARGPANKVRFLAKSGSAGCGSGRDVAYYAFEWTPGPFSGNLEQIVKVEGSVSQEDAAEKYTPAERNREEAFFPIGKLKTDGPVITLPYCRFTAIDTYHNPSLCFVDSWDLSGSRPRFLSTDANRPDLLPVARAIEHAQARDYPAVLAYCASPAVARALVRDIPSFVFAGFLKVRRTGVARETVTFGDPPAWEFGIEERGGRWLITRFSRSLTGANIK